MAWGWVWGSLTANPVGSIFKYTQALTLPHHPPCHVLTPVAILSLLGCWDSLPTFLSPS